MKAINAEEDVKKGESSYTVGGNVNWQSHYGEHYGDSFRNLKKKSMCNLIHKKLINQQTGVYMMNLLKNKMKMDPYFILINISYFDLT